MIKYLPNKYVPIDSSLLGVSANLFQEIQHNDTVSTLWDRVSAKYQVRTFDRFASALSLLFAARLIEFDNGIIYRNVVQARL